MSIDLLTMDNNKLIMAGQMAIANCVLNTITHPNANSPANAARLKVLYALQDQYYEVMAEPLSVQLTDPHLTAGNPSQSKLSKE